MLNLKHNYFIDSDGNCLKLCKRAVRHDDEANTDRFVSSNKLNKLFDDALSQINDSDNNPFNTWIESIRAATTIFVSGIGGDQK